LNSVNIIFPDEVGKQSVVDNYEEVLYIELENKGLLFTFAPKEIGNHFHMNTNTIFHTVCHTL